MALIKCPECSKEISDSASGCPHCGYALKEVVAVTAHRKTELGERQRNLPLGIFLIFMGITAILGGLFLIFVFVGIFSIIGGVAMIIFGCRNIGWSQGGNCPYCGTPVKVLAAAMNFECVKCKKTCVKNDNLLETVE